MPTHLNGLRQYILTFILLTISLNAFGALTNKQLFDVTSANEKLTILSKEIDQSNIEYLKKSALLQLEQLNVKAKDCVSKAKTQLSTLNELLEADKALNLSDAEKQADYQYITEKKKLYQNQLSDCRLFVFHSNEVITTIKGKIHAQGASSLFKRSTPLWQLFTNSNEFNLQGIDLNKLYQKSGLSFLLYQPLFILLGLLALTFLLALMIKKMFSSWLGKHLANQSLLVALVSTINRYLFPLVLLGTTSLFLFVVSRNHTFDYTIELISYYSLIYFILLGIATFLLYPNKPATPSLLKIPRKTGKKALFRIALFGLLVVLHLSIAATLRDQSLTLQIKDIEKAAFVILLSINIIWILWLFNTLEWATRLSAHARIIYKFILLLFLLFLIIAEVIGYHSLVIYIVYSLFLSMVLIALLWCALIITNRSINLLNNPNLALSKKIRFHLGVKPHKALKELSLVKLGFAIAFILIFIALWLKAWQISPNLVDQFANAIFEGFKLMGLPIVPVQIITALLVFPVLLMLGRWLSSYSARHHQFQGEKDTQVAIASIIIYSSFAIALLVALLVAGVNLTGLAIIAGALSVGIGLGLQNIVNNFASGIILLLEKPIKPGDRVIVDNIEGFVKKVRVRSTQITTLAKEDVIVPNADLISSKVTNYMFRNKLWRVTCRVGVAYGSNIDLVRQTLLNIAQQHPDIVQEEGNQPIAYFVAFGDSSLQFELWCIIKDVNKKFQVLSDLHFAIDKAFKAHKITIAFPQRDVHIRTLTENISTSHSAS